MKLRLLLCQLLLTAALTVSAASPKYIFYFIGDGMGPGAVALTQTYNRMVLGSDTLLKMMQFPVASMAFTYSASSPVTDSAAAGTALATGHKTKNGMIGQNADSVAVTSIAKRLHDNGFSVALITTVSPDDATPAAFYAHQPYRGMSYEIGRDAAECGFEFLAGADWRGAKDKDGKDTDLLKHFKKNGVDVVRGLDALASADSRRVVLLAENPFNANEIGYVVDSVAGQMSLRQMTKAGLDHLLKVSPDRFFMMVEGGMIDHAGHSNDPAALVMETLAFDQALALAYDFYLAHPEETLIVVTADHETGGLALANSTYHYNIEPKFLQYPKASFDKFGADLKALMRSRMVVTWQDMKQQLTDRFGFYNSIQLTEEQNAGLKEAFETALKYRAEGDTRQMTDAASKFAGEVFAIVNSVCGAGWTTHDHSGMPVPVFAIGNDAPRFSAIQDNTDLPKKILEIAGFAQVAE